MSTTEYLKTLNKEQLNHAIEVAQQLIREIEDEPKFDVWQVYDERSVPKIFHSQGEAINYLRKLVDKYERNEPVIGWVFRIEPIELAKSEIEKRMATQN